MSNEMETSSESTVVVPWFSMVEWKEVYKQIYSNDRHQQQKGYEQLLVWKARCPTLPAGVECTLGLLQIHLYDQEVGPQISSGQLPAYREKDLRLMYATAVMRFLNHISSVAQELDSMFGMARRLHIPTWIVNIRHNVAHASTMPPLSVLREALEFAFAWINENYWKNETDVTTDFVALEDFDDSGNKQFVTKLIHLIELWQALKLYLQVGYDEMKSIPDEKLKSDIYTFMRSSYAPGSDPSNPSIDPYTDDKMGDQMTQKVLVLMKIKMRHFLLEHKNSLTKDESLTTILLKGETFLLSESLISLLNIDETDKEGNLPEKLCVLWEGSLRFLQEVDVLPSLLAKLIVLSGQKGESAHRRKMAAIWAREICRAVAKAREMSHVKEIMAQEWTSKTPLSFDTDLGKFNLRVEFKKYYPELETAISLRALNLPVLDHDLVKLAMNEPSMYTDIFLPSLLKLAEPALSKTCQANLLRVMTIYTAKNMGHQLRAADPFTPFTVESLKAIMGEEETEDASENFMPQPDYLGSAGTESQETWSRCDDYHEWEMCPIGVLPWQRHLTLVEFSLPSETVWTMQAKPASEKTTLERAELRLTKVDWEDYLDNKKSKKLRKKFPNKK